MARTNIRGTQIVDGSVDLTVDVENLLPVANGGTGAGTLTGVLIGNGTSAVTAVTAPSSAIVGTTDSQTLTNKTLTTPVINGAVSGTGVSTTAVANTLAQRDTNGNLAAVAFNEGYTATATAAGTTTLTVSSNFNQVFTGSSTQILVMPVVSTLTLGQQWTVINLSSGAVTVQSSGANTIVTLAANTQTVLTCILTSGTTAASWNAIYYANIVTSGKTLSVSNSLILAGTDATTITFQGTDTYVGRATTDTLTNKRVSQRVTSTTSTATLTVNTDTTDLAILTAQAAALTVANPTGTPVTGDMLRIRIKDNGTARAITWGTLFIASGITGLPTTTVINKTMWITFYWDEVASKWVCMAADVTGY